MGLRFYNTFSKRVEDFVPLSEGKVSLYSCGPTVYSHPHIGNFRSFLMADLLKRFLEFKGYDVTHVMNITDVGHLLEDAICVILEIVEEISPEEANRVNVIRDKVQKALRQYFYFTIGRRPVILPFIIEV